MEYYFAFCVFVAIFAIVEGFYPGYRISNWSRGLYLKDKVIFWSTIFVVSVILAPLLAISCFFLNKQDLVETVTKSLDRKHTH